MFSVKGAFRNNLRDRPFDFYVAFLIFLAGCYALLSTTWPESVHNNSTSILIHIVSAYMVLSSLIVITSLLCNRSKRPIFSIMAEMWGWLAISAASSATFLMYSFMLATKDVADLGLAAALDLVWLGMALASGFRSLDIYLAIRRAG